METKQLKQELKEVCDGLKTIKKEFSISRLSRDEAILRHIIHNTTGKYIPFTFKNSKDKTAVGKTFKLLLQKAHLFGKIKEKIDNKQWEDGNKS